MTAEKIFLLLGICISGVLSSAINRESPAPGDADVYTLYAGFGDEARSTMQRRGSATNTHSCDKVRRVPSDVRRELDLNNFYQKYTETYGIPIITSSRVDDSALQRACYVARFLLADHYSIRNGYYKRNGRFALIGRTEKTTDLPEYQSMGAYWNDRARGFGPFGGNGVSSGAEENALCESSRVDRWYRQDIVLHEFAHGLHLLGAKFEYSNFQKRLNDAYRNAKNAGKWNNTYAMNNDMEYFAEAVGSYFNEQIESQSGRPDGIKNHVNSRWELQEYDPALYQLVKEMFPCNNKYIRRCEDTGQEKGLNQRLKMNYPDCRLEADTGPKSSKCGSCSNMQQHCDYWARSGYCQSNKSYMNIYCKKACGFCSC